MAALPILLVAAGTAQAASAIRQGNYANNVAKVQAENLNQQASATRGLTVIREEAQRKNAREVIGSQLAAGAEAGGSLSGSNLDALRESMMNAEMDALGIRYEGEVKARGLENEATATRARGRQAQIGGYLSAAGSLAMAGASYLNAGGTIPSSPTQKQLIHAGGL